MTLDEVSAEESTSKNCAFLLGLFGSSHTNTIFKLFVDLSYKYEAKLICFIL